MTHPNMTHSTPLPTKTNNDCYPENSEQPPIKVVGDRLRKNALKKLCNLYNKGGKSFFELSKIFPKKDGKTYHHSTVYSWYKGNTKIPDHIVIQLMESNIITYKTNFQSNRKKYHRPCLPNTPPYSQYSAEEIMILIDKAEENQGEP